MIFQVFQIFYFLWVRGLNARLRRTLLQPSNLPSKFTEIADLTACQIDDMRPSWTLVDADVVLVVVLFVPVSCEL